MRNIRIGVALLLTAFAMSSCLGNMQEIHPTIQYVRDILADKTGPEMDALRRARVLDPNADISVLGAEDVCDALSELFYEYDVRDNVSGSLLSDGLPDFAGETFDFIKDDSSYYKSLILSGAAEELRKQVVMRSICAVDTVSHISPYDVEGLASKKSSKILILADSYLSEFGKFDVDTLFSSSGCATKVLSSFDLMLDKLFASAGGKDLRVGIICTPRTYDSGICASRFKSKSKEYGSGNSECWSISSESKDSLFVKLLHKYMSEGNVKPLDAVLVEDITVSVDSLKSERADLVSVMNESSVTYGSLFSRDFVLMDSFSTVASECYAILRKGNLFTHNIAKPQSVFYRTVEKPLAEDGSIILIPDSYVQN